MNLLIALVLLPVAQAFVIPVGADSTLAGLQDEAVHCPDMKVKTCDSAMDCEAVGMHCVDSINLAIIYDNQWPANAIKESPGSSIIISYFYLNPLKLLRPPRSY